jgi:ATP-binding cassette subfamily C protein LapB
VAVRRSSALRAVAEQRAGHDDQRHDFIMESLSGIESIKSMAMEPQIQRRFERLQQVGVKASHDAILLGNEAQNGGNLLSSLTMISVVTVGALMVIGGSLSMGTLAACTLLSGRTIQPLLRGLDLWTQIQSLSVTRRRVCSLFELPEAPAIAAPVVNCTGVIAVRNLGFAHAPDRPAVFSNLDLDVAAGEFLGLRGGDGVGKSTLLSILRGDLVPSRGEVRIDGYDPSGPHRAALGAMVASVPQSAELFRGTILENITLFRTGEAIDSAREAARLIGLEAIIHHLPEGYDTMVGEGVSSTLPDGLCQRIAIARALAGRPKILLFDEANSALDVKSDRLLREGLATLKGRMTVILASQRPSLLRIADRIVVLRDGALHAASADLDEVPRDTAPAQRLAAS